MRRFTRMVYLTISLSKSLFIIYFFGFATAICLGRPSPEPLKGENPSAVRALDESFIQLEKTMNQYFLTLEKALVETADKQHLNSEISTLKQRLSRLKHAEEKLLNDYKEKPAFSVITTPFGYRMTTQEAAHVSEVKLNKLSYWIKKLDSSANTISK